ncbi:MAG: MATE family efflux transporter [Clostridia bacterium]|nr:MATE family efflux transporter [Clostridia bacterium]
MHRNAKSHSMLMTEGPIARQLIAFALPLLLGNLFQQLYNTADSLIVGNFLGSEALAAVSSSSNLIHLMVGFFNGVAGGAGVVIARHYGARDIPRVQKTIHTMLAFGVAAGLLLTAVGVSLTPTLLRMMGTPETVLPQSISYFRTYFYGSIAFVLYNICMGILQAVGDSRHPLQYLIISSIINVVLDLLFVGVFGWGVGSAAAATAISQLVSMVLCMIRLMHSDRDYRVDLRKVRVELQALREILRNGLPSGVANCIISVANVVVQANINAFGAQAMAGCGAHTRIEGFAFLPVICFNMALTTFVSQNLGAQRYDRARRGVRIGVLCSMAVAESVALLIYVFSPVLIGLFDSTPEVVAFGVMHQRTIVPFFFLCAFSHSFAAVFRGAGRAMVSMMVMAVCWCAVRVPFVTLTTALRPVLTSVSIAYPFTWSLSALVFLVLYFRTGWLRGKEPERA